MTETLAPPRTAPLHTERKTGGHAEAIWRQSDSLVSDNLKTAFTNLKEQGDMGSPEPKDVVQLAHANHERALTEVDREDMTTDDYTAQHMALVMLGMPFATEAKAAVEQETFHSGRERAETLAPLTQFNHDLAETLRYMPRNMTPQFAEQAWLRAAEFYQKFRLPVMPKQEFMDIVHGMGREVAFLKALQTEDRWQVEPATVEQDVKGIDIVASDGETIVNMDIKGEGKFDRTVEKLRIKGEITDIDAQLAKQDGYVRVTYNYGRHGSADVWVVDADRLGIVSQFEYENPVLAHKLVEQLFAHEQELGLRNIGNHAIS